jgi:hypothetical protein
MGTLIRKSSLIVVGVWCSLSGDPDLTTSRRVLEEVKRSGNKLDAANLVWRGFNKFYFQPPKDNKTNIITALKYFFGKYGESPFVSLYKKAIESEARKVNNAATNALRQSTARKAILRDIGKNERELERIRKEQKELKAVCKKLVNAEQGSLEELLTSERQKRDVLLARKEELLRTLQQRERGRQ